MRRAVTGEELATAAGTALLVAVGVVVMLRRRAAVPTALDGHWSALVRAVVEVEVLDLEAAVGLGHHAVAEATAGLRRS